MLLEIKLIILFICLSLLLFFFDQLPSPENGSEQESSSEAEEESSEDEETGEEERSRLISRRTRGRSRAGHEDLQRVKPFLS